MSFVADNIDRVKEELAGIIASSGRQMDDVTLMAVSKTWPAEHIQKAVDAGHSVFGENKLQEGELKIPKMPAHLEWHFIGGIQRNKVRKILPLFNVIHSVDSTKLANHINNVALDFKMKPRVYLQINIGEEEQKGGFSEEGIFSNLDVLLQFEAIHIEGLMCIPPAVERVEDSREHFVALRELRDRIESKFSISLPGLSMGMSADYKIAVEEGSTIIRVGSSIFGKRDYPA